MKTYTLCGSMRFCSEMKAIAYELEVQKGYNILQCAYCPEETASNGEELQRLREAHFRKIDMSDGIYVVNIGGYIGESVRAEIEYAQRNNKEIIYYCDAES